MTGEQQNNTAAEEIDPFRLEVCNVCPDFYASVPAP
jgi:hypothetical protein